MSLPNGSGQTHLSRRTIIRLLGTGAGLGVAGLAFNPDLLAGSFAPVSDSTFPPGAIVRTVLGDIDPTSITGITLHHEHLGSGRPLPGKKPRRPSEDIDWMTEEMVGIKIKYNVGCIVSALTGFPDADTRDYLKELSRRSGIHLVLSGGYYMESRYPPETHAQSEDQIADQLIQMAKEFGMGAYGEIGMSNNAPELSDTERKVYRAMGKAQARNGLPIFTHSSYGSGPLVPNDIALHQLDALEAGGADPAHIILGHMDCLFEPDAKTAIACAKRNVFVGFDRLTRQQQMVSNENKVKVIKAFIDAGYLNQLCLSSDYAGMIVLFVGEVERQPGPYWFTDGGPGWARSIAWFDPLLRQAGVTEAQINTIRYDNERRWLAFVPKN
jgi:phosphotriesterase-related protein